jgi:hypothetical protein
VAINHCDIESAAVLPPEYNTPLIIDSDRVEPFHTSLERLKTIAWRHPQVIEHGGVVQIQQLAPRRPSQLYGKTPCRPRLTIEEQVLRQHFTEAFDHFPMLSKSSNSRNDPAGWAQLQTEIADVEVLGSRGAGESRIDCPASRVAAGRRVGD